MPPTRSVHVAAPPADRILEHTTWSVLRRIGLDLTPEDSDLVRNLIPFVIDPEFLYTIPPLESLPPAIASACRSTASAIRTSRSIRCRS